MFSNRSLVNQTVLPLPDPAPEPAYLRGLNPPQRQAVLTSEGPVLMLAGAGTGKTAALTARLAHLIATRRAWPSEILAVTFTNKAAREMKHRIGGMIGDAVEGMPWLGTFHAIAAKMLRRHAELVGLHSNFTILDTDDQLRVLKQLIEAEGVDAKRWPPKQLAGLIDRWKNRGLTPADLDAGDNEAWADGRGRHFYALYQARLRALNACDFGDLLLHMLVILRGHGDVLAGYQARFKYIMVDEYQDTNASQYLWLRLLAQGRSNICCVGDDDQSIYSWRGAEVTNILRFERDFSGAAVIRLEQNYRSTPQILAAASGLIAHNGNRLGKTLWTDAPPGEKVQVMGVWDGPEEARRVAERLEDRLRDGAGLNASAILVRAQFQTREFEDRFIATGLPYRIIGGFRFYERAEIRDALAYLRLIASPADDLAFERIVNTPKRGLGDKALQAIFLAARADGVPLARAAARLCEGQSALTPQARRGLAGFVAGLRHWQEQAAVLSHAALAQLVLDESGYTAMLQADRSVEAAGRLENLAELVRAMEEYDSLEAFLEHVSLVMDRDTSEDADQVTIMTIHAAKGLEFDDIHLVGWEDGVFPSQRALDEGGTASLEEERRLAYVAVTRARRRCTIWHAANRRIYGQWTSSIPSRFIAELPAEHIDRVETMSGGASMWQANWTANADPFAHVAQHFGARGGLPGTRGPAWTRAAAAAANPANLPTTATRAPPPSERAPAAAVGALPRRDLVIGMRVFHDKFGYGQIDDIDGNKLEVAFDQAGTKRLLDTYITIV